MNAALPRDSLLPATGEQVADVFHAVFAARYHTRLEGGADEPYYRPAAGGTPARILFRHDYTASALHEVAHWCIAGPERRQQADYGYWYAPDGRDAARQRQFVDVEAWPQALEWLFSLAAGCPFCISVDNLAAPRDTAAEASLAEAVAAQARALRDERMPVRAAQFFDALKGRFYPSLCLQDVDFSVHALL